MSAALRVLLVEDDLDIAASLGDFLEAAGLQLDFAYNAAQAKARVAAATFDVLVLDVNLPGGDGFSLCQTFKTQQGLAAPVLFLTARGDLSDKLRGFSAGAVDYVVKPFAPQELLARIQALSRLAAGSQEKSQLSIGTYTLDISGCSLQQGEHALPLSATGFVLLKTLMQACPGTVPAEALARAVWGDQLPESDPLRAHIHQLRRQLNQQFGRPLISTVRGVGYRFDGN